MTVTSSDSWMFFIQQASVSLFTLQLGISLPGSHGLKKWVIYLEPDPFPTGKIFQENELFQELMFIIVLQRSAISPL